MAGTDIAADGGTSASVLKIQFTFTTV
jgi:hypothetical protein